MDKHELRKELKALRNHFSQAQVNYSSKIIADFILQSECYKSAQLIMGYLAFGKEISVDKVLQQALADHKRVFVPYILSATEMCAVEITDLQHFSHDKFGIRTVSKPEITVNEQLLDFILVPGVAFAEDGSRMGMGAGYYDRFLVKCSKAAVCGVAYQSLLQTELPTDIYDVSVDYLVCEKGFFKV